VKPFIQASARSDILRQYRYYLDQNLPDIAERFLLAVKYAVDTAIATPDAGTPKHLDNPQLAGLRTWTIHGFDEFRLYYLVRNNSFTVVRVLHGRRDIGSILENQPVEDPRTP
jgi:plasmid stabilization system protein ParE